jgi:hypothetical protein
MRNVIILNYVSNLISQLPGTPIKAGQVDEAPIATGRSTDNVSV